MDDQRVERANDLGYQLQPEERSSASPPPRRPHGEEIRRIEVDEEDRLAFRVGVNILTLVLIGIATYLVWRNFFR